MINLKDRGYKLCIATGRGFATIPDCILNYNKWDGYICANGQSIYNENKKLIRIVEFPKSLYIKCLELANKTNTSLIVKTNKRTYLANFVTDAYINTYIFYNQKPWSKGELEIGEQITGLLLTRGCDANYDDFKNIDGIKICIGLNNAADINICECSKYEGIKFYLRINKYDSYLAFGDSSNDFEMLKNASISVAMGNAPEDVKKLCSFVTKPVYDDGISYAVSRLLIGGFV